MCAHELWTTVKQAPCIKRVRMLMDNYRALLLYWFSQQSLNIFHKPDTTLDSGESAIKKARFLLSWSLCMCRNPVRTAWDKARKGAPSVPACCKHALYGTVVVQLLSRVWRSVTPWSVTCQAPLSFTISQSSLKFMSNESFLKEVCTYLPTSFTGSLQGLNAEMQY